MTTKYTLADIGCYVDGTRGIYAVDRIVEIAEEHGLADVYHPVGHQVQHSLTHDTSEWAGCEFAGEVEDEATDHMNTHYAPEGAYWGRNDNGDWGLWPVEDEPS